jgi:hypothetical protein
MIKDLNGLTKPGQKGLLIRNSTISCNCLANDGYPFSLFKKMYGSNLFYSETNLFASSTIYIVPQPGQIK